MREIGFSDTGIDIVVSTTNIIIGYLLSALFELLSLLALLKFQEPTLRKEKVNKPIAAQIKDTS